MSNENLTEKTLADVKAGIPARDAEIETLRKENAALREQLEAIGAGGVSGKLMPGKSQQPVSGADGLPEGWKVVPIEPTRIMTEAAKAAYMPFGDMEIALRCAIMSAPTRNNDE